MKLHQSSRAFVLTGLSALLLVACSAGSDAGTGGSAGTPTPAGGGGAGGAAPQGGSAQGGDPSLGGGFTTGGNGQGGGIICDPGGPDDDVDADGFTPNQGDCEDCDPNRNPNAIEVPTKAGDTPFDENCDGVIDEALADPCDAAIAVDEMDPLAAARAVELCKMSTGVNDWGVVSATWVMADGAAPPTDPAQLANFHRGHGFVGDWGPNVDVRKGDRMLVLSGGTARRPTDPGYSNVSGFSKGYGGNFATGTAPLSPVCPGVTTGPTYDPTGVELVVRTPSNATGFSFDFDFYSYEWPGYVCSTFNDYFWAILSPIPMGSADGNISFDSLGNPVSVNNALMQVCGCDGNPPNPCYAGGQTFDCPLGNIELIGTGFGFDTAFSDHAATGWLRTTAPVAANSEISLRFAVHDSGDGILDSTTLVDNFLWTAEPGTTVGTNPVPE